MRPVIFSMGNSIPQHLPIPTRLIRRRLMIAHQMSARRYLSGAISRACQYVTAVTLTLSKLRDQTNLAR
jgi:hypothetical protein